MFNDPAIQFKANGDLEVDSSLPEFDAKRTFYIGNHLDNGKYHEWKFTVKKCEGGLIIPTSGIASVPQGTSMGPHVIDKDEIELFYTEEEKKESCDIER